MEKERALKIFRTMNRIRDFENRAYQLFCENKLHGSVHLYIGEEAVAATVCSRLSDEDYIASTHRGHGHCIAKGASADRAMAELMGRDTGYCRGHSGSMHIADLTQGNLGANAIVGAGVPIAVGAALALKMKGKRHVAVAFFGDGASNQGAVHEAMNLASVWKLPIIFVVENNGFAITVPVSQSTSVEDISVRGAAYHMPGVTVDGNDVLAIDEAFSKAQARALAGEGPSLIECKTCRWAGHWTGDPEVYRTKADVEYWKVNKDPIRNFGKYLVDNGIAEQAELDQIRKEESDGIEAAVTFAMNSPQPDPAHVLDDVFYDECEGGHHE